MSDQVNNLSGKVGLDTTDYKAGVTELNRQIRVIESGFRASAAAMGDWDKSATGLEARNKALNDTMDLQKKKVEALTAEYKKIVDEKGADSRAAEEMQIKINKETQALNKNQTELSGNTEKLADVKKGTKEVGDEEDKAAKKTISFRDALKGLGTVGKDVSKIIAGVAVAAYGAVAGLAGFVVQMAGMGDNIAESAQKAGVSVEKYQELDFIGKQIGLDVDTVAGAMNRMVISMDKGRVSTSEQGKAFAELGVDVKDNVTGKLRDSRVVFDETMVSLRNMKDDTERDVLTNKLFGKSYAELKPLIETSSEELQNMTDKAHLLGAVMSDKAVKGLGDFNDLLDGLKSGIKGVAGTIAADLLPGFTGIATGLQGYLMQLSSVVNGSNGDVGKMTKGIGGLLGTMVSDLGKKLPGILTAGLGIIQGIVDAIITNLPVLIPAVVQIIQSLVDFILQNLPVLLAAAIQIIMALATGLIQMLPHILVVAIQIIVTLIQGLTQALPQLLQMVMGLIPILVITLIQNLPLLITAALQLILALVKGLVAALPQLLQMVMGLIPILVITLIQNLPLLITAALQLILALVKGLVAALPMLIQSIPTIITSIVDTLINNLPDIILAAVQIIMALVFGIIQNIPLLLEATPQIIQALVDKFKSPEFKDKMKEAGKALVDGLKQGWTDMWANFKANIVENFSGLVTTIKKLLGIASPSYIARGIMQDFWKGGILGSEEQFKVLRQSMTSSINQLVNVTANGLSAGAGGNMRLAGAGGAGQYNNSSETYQFFGPVTLAGEAGTSMAQKIKAKRY